MKKLILILSIFSCFSIAEANAEDEKTVTLTVSGTGSTKEIATQNALRSAIEQAFGAFISSKTEVLNDSLVKDEIVSVTNGNIQKYDVVSEVQIPNTGTAITLKAIVSVTKLTSFCESKGVVVEFRGGLFVANIKQQQLNERSEYEAIKNLCRVSMDILSKSIDFDLKLSEPIATSSADTFAIPMTVSFKSNSNKKTFYDYFINSLNSISMAYNEIEDYKTLQKSVAEVAIEKDSSIYSESQITYGNDKIPIGKLYYLRNPNSILAVKNLLFNANNLINNFKVFSELDTLTLIGDKTKLWAANSYKFPPFGIPFSDFLVDACVYTSGRDNYEEGKIIRYGRGIYTLFMDLISYEKKDSLYKYLSCASFTCIDNNVVNKFMSDGRSPSTSVYDRHAFDADNSIFIKKYKETNGQIIFGHPQYSEKFGSFVSSGTNGETFLHFLSLEQMQKISKYQITPITFEEYLK